MSKVVQESFGEKIIEAVVGFAKVDLKTVDQLKADEFSHVADANLCDALAVTFYGTRWLYKLGLALLVKDAEQLAHVRAQVMDYGAVCEGLLSDALHHALAKNILHGQKYRYADIVHLSKPINWNVQDKLGQLCKQTFFWQIEVAAEEGIIDQNLQGMLHSMRLERNTVHMRARTHRAFIGTSKALFDTSLETIRQTKVWRAANP